MRRLLLLFLVIENLLFSDYSQAQAGLWTWMKGDSTNDATGIFGTQGIPAADNKPPGYYEPAEWTAQQNMLWFYGGFNYISSASDNIWRYDILTNEWTWMKGAGNVSTAPVYGTQGVFDAANTPGLNQWCAATWVDTSGYFWLFGGSNGSGSSVNLLWKYDPALNQWARIRGSTTSGNPGNYGTQGIPSPNNDPPARWETNATWTDTENNLWLFGGYQGSTFNDLWKYDIVTNEWTWMKGSNITNQQGVYGTQGVPDPSNTPGSRWVYTKWTDDAGNLWLFGGNGYTAGPSGSLNDLWRYNPNSNEWTWISGSNAVNDPGVTGPLCELSPDYFPSGRYETRSCWKDENGNFWLYGGYANFGESNDLWIYVPDSNAWAIVSESPAINGIYGTQGVATSSTHPPTKMGALAWATSPGELWLTSGGFASSASIRNDLWKYNIDPDCPLISESSLTAFSASDSSLCEKFCIDFTDQSGNNPTSWLWQFPGGIPSSSTNQNPTNICYDVPGSYDVTLITTNVNGLDTLVLTNFITVYPTPPFPVITVNGNLLLSSPAATYQWQFNSIDIPGATNQTYIATQNGFYTVIIGDINDCNNSATVQITITGSENLSLDKNISIYPNPSDGSFIIEWTGNLIGESASVRITNTLGQLVFESQFQKEIELSGFVPGIYFIEINTNDASMRKKVIISN